MNINVVNHFEEIDPSPYLHNLNNISSTSLGVAPKLEWIEISKLRVDKGYQRKVGKKGLKNIRNIIINFDWAKFGVAIISNIEGTDLYALVDAQHRCIAAAARSITKVPCCIIEAKRKEQAEAFVSINTEVTLVSPLAAFHAKCLAGNEECLSIRDACEAADVFISNYAVPTNQIKPGHTVALGAIQKVYKVYGENHLVFTLRSILGSNKNRVRGMLREPIIRGLAHLFDIEPLYKKEAVIRSLNEFDFSKSFDEATINSRKSKRPVFIEFSMIVSDFLEGKGF